MKNVLNFVKDNSLLFVILLSVLTLFRECGYENEIEKSNKRYEQLNSKVDSLYNKVLTPDEVTKLIKTTPAWTTLRLEEISDKEKISINALERRNSK